MLPSSVTFCHKWVTFCHNNNNNYNNNICRSILFQKQSSKLSKTELRITIHVGFITFYFLVAYIYWYYLLGIVIPATRAWKFISMLIWIVMNGLHPLLYLIFNQSVTTTCSILIICFKALCRRWRRAPMRMSSLNFYYCRHFKTIWRKLGAIDSRGLLGKTSYWMKDFEVFSEVKRSK